MARQVIVMPSATPGEALPTQAQPIDPVDRLAELSALHDRGRLTDEEVEQAKRLLLGNA
jgi:hypothetical protein